MEADGKYLNGEKIAKLEQNFAENAVGQWKRLASLEFEQLKRKGLQMRCYVFKRVFEKLKMDWKPGEEMKDAVKGKKFADENFWKVPKEERENSIYWRKMLNPRENFYPE